MKRPTRGMWLAGFLWLVVAAFGFCESGKSIAGEKKFDPDSSIEDIGVACIQCHKQEHPGIFADWARSRHAGADVTCLDCHLADESDPDVSKDHYKHFEASDSEYGRKEFRVPVTAVVTPKDCAQCHTDEVDEYAKSKHANTMEIMWKIDPWLKDGMNSDVERSNGCYYCHGSVLRTENGEISSDTWPNVGVGRVNLDGSLGCCTSCHTRHRFSIMEARKPEACGQCHLGPDHPQTEIYKESKHGDIYAAFKDEYKWNAASGAWSAGRDYRGPTCASCHMSGAGTVRTSHDVTERLSWELQAPLTIRPEKFEPFPAKSGWRVEREKMKEICRQCHGDKWINDHYIKMDKAVEEYNTVYFTPAKALLDELYDLGLLDKTRFLDEPMEVEFYELWHHEGRRARMGTAMMGPDYSWWHGFYECKNRYVLFMKEGRDLIEKNEKAYKAPDYPNATGDTKPPPEVFDRKK